MRVAMLRRSLLPTVALALAAGLAACSHAVPHDGHDATPPAPSDPVPAPGIGARDVDEALHAAWKDAGLEPSAKVDDAGFLRRAWLDLAGTVPPPDAVTRFEADAAPDKRHAAIAELMKSPRWAEHWANVWERLLLGPMVRMPIVDRQAFHDWVKDAFAANMPYDQMVYQLVTATGRNQAEDEKTPINGAVNWLLRFRGVPEDLAGTTSRVFLGVQIQCAQCHDHKSEKWKQDDFRRFTACFMRTKATAIDKKTAKNDLLVRDTERPSFLRQGKKMLDASPYAAAQPAALDGTDLSHADNPRQALARWMIDPHNPWFAKAFVNRVWGALLGRGFVEPVDDLRASNPALLPAVLDELAADFTAHGYDVRRLVGILADTEAYQLSSKPAARGDGALWSRYPLKPLGPDELLDAIVAATGTEPLLERIGDDDLDALRAALRKQMAFLFDVDEQPQDTGYEGTIAQALMLLNGRLVNGGASAIPGDALANVLAERKGDAAAIEALYLRTLSRRPSQEELDHWTAFVKAPREAVAWQPPAPPPPKRGNNPAKAAFVGERRLARTERLVPRQETPRQQAFEDVLWALLNSTEFTFNH
jgi:hypothetical protein